MFAFWSNAFAGKEVYAYIRVAQETDQVCRVTVLTRKDLSKRDWYSKQVKWWLEAEGLLAE